MSLPSLMNEYRQQCQYTLNIDLTEKVVTYALARIFSMDENQPVAMLRLSVILEGNSDGFSFLRTSNKLVTYSSSD